MPDHHEATLFLRYNRPLHTLWLESQAWFCARELGRLIGRYLDEQIIRRLDADQHRTVALLRYGECRDTVMISESGAIQKYPFDQAPQPSDLGTAAQALNHQASDKPDRPYRDHPGLGCHRLEQASLPV